MASLNTRYLSSNRGVIKIVQIIIGFIICSLLCGNWYGGRNCFGEGRLGFASGLNFVVVIVNIVLLILNFIDLAVYSLERLYSVITTILFLVATGLLIWFIIEHNAHGTVITATILVGIQFLLFLWDVKILQGEAPN